MIGLLNQNSQFSKMSMLRIANRGQFTAAATSATKSNGVPAAVHGLNFARTYGSADHHHEGRSDAPARFAVASNFSTTKTVFSCRSHLFFALFSLTLHSTSTKPQVLHLLKSFRHYPSTRFLSI